jgi:hypothetical protein
MKVWFHPHARDRLIERGTSEDEVIVAVKAGEKFNARFGRVGFRRNLPFRKRWRGKRYKLKQVEVYAIERHDGWFVISVVTRYF